MCFVSILIILIIRESNNYKIIYYILFYNSVNVMKNEISKIKVNCNINN